MNYIILSKLVILVLVSGWFGFVTLFPYLASIIS